MPDDLKPGSQAHILLFHGDDEYEMNKEVEALARSVGDAGLAELNFSRLDGQANNLDEMMTAANTLPFLAERRLVILANPLARQNSEAAQARFRSFLEGVPASTTLVLAVADHQVREEGRLRWKELGEKHWLRTWAAKHPEQVKVTNFFLPKQPADMAKWVLARARQAGGEFSPQAAAVLVSHIDFDKFLAELEIDKMLNYVNFNRRVESDDVEQLTAAHGQKSIFDLVDAMGSGRSEVAIRTLHRLLDQEEQEMIFGMVVRQFRLLLQAREILDEGGNVQAIKTKLRQHEYVAGKLDAQARRFSMEELKTAYRGLAEIDRALKTSQMSFVQAFEIFIAKLSLEANQRR